MKVAGKSTPRTSSEATTSTKGKGKGKKKRVPGFGEEESARPGGPRTTNPWDEFADQGAADRKIPSHTDDFLDESTEDAVVNVQLVGVDG